MIANPVPLEESLGRQLPNEPRARLPLAVRLSPRPHTMAGKETDDDDDDDDETAAALGIGRALKNVEEEQHSEEGTATSDAMATIPTEFRLR